MKKRIFLCLIALFMIIPMVCQAQTAEEQLAEACKKAGLPEAKHTFLQKNLQAPLRLYLPMPDNSGKVNTDTTFLADRLAILNHMSAYSYLLDERHMEEWYGLWTDDCEFQFLILGHGVGFIHGLKNWRKFCDFRFDGPGSQNALWIRRHIQSNAHVVNQTATTAEARLYMTISETWPGGLAEKFMTGTYAINLIKKDGAWKINRFYVDCDSTIPMRGIKETADVIDWVPARAEKLKWEPVKK